MGAAHARTSGLPSTRKPTPPLTIREELGAVVPVSRGQMDRAGGSRLRPAVTRSLPQQVACRDAYSGRELNERDGRRGQPEVLDVAPTSGLSV
jgi:hypothetical protein